MSPSLRRSPSHAANASVLPAELHSRPLLREVAGRVRAVVRTERHYWRSYLAYRPLIRRVRELTMVPELMLMGLAEQVQTVLSENVPGDLVECGVWRGGSAFLMAQLLRRAGEKGRKVWLFDSFEGLPPVGPRDGVRAHEWQADVNSPWYLDNCRASLEDVERSRRLLGLVPYTECVKGWFNETLPSHRERVGPIALLRIDADWYESVLCCLDNLYDQVSDGGLVVFDDYYTYDGCVLAVHEFLASHSLPHRLYNSYNQLWFRKS
jgi:O-methyltransferase